MSETNRIDYLNIAELIEHYNLDMTAAEAHGIITGSVCTQVINPDENNWLTLLTPYEPLEGDELASLTNSLELIYSLTKQELDSESFEFTAVLPDSDASNDFRVRELASWCRGFSLAYQQFNQHNERLSDDAIEAIEDIKEFAQLESAGDDEEEDAMALAELEEYLRVGVQMVFEDINPAVTIH